METFNSYIDEFVDWVTGEDTSEQEVENKTRVSSTDGLPVSGGSIRELLLTRLKSPFVYYEDTVAGLYRLFSSESTKSKWIRMNTPESPDYDPENSKKLELFNFVRPSDLTMTYQGLNPNPRYIINGDSSSASAQLSYNVYLSKELGGGTVYESDSFTVTYKVIDSNGVEHVLAEEKDSTYLNSSKAVVKNIYSMLTVGQNTVTVIMKARNSSAGNSVTFPVYLIEFELNSTFNFANHWDPKSAITIPVSVKRSDASLTLEVNVYAIHGNSDTSASGTPIATWVINTQETNPTHIFNVDNVYLQNITSSDHIKHMFKIEAKMYNLDASSVYYSNILFYDFVVASDTVGIVNNFVNIGYSVPFTKLVTEDSGRPILQAQQYELFILPWSYYTDRESTYQTIDIQWAFRKETNGVYTYTPITIVQGQNKTVGENLRFIPDFYTTDDSVYLVALYNNTEIDAFPIHVAKSSLSVVETGGYNLKLSAYGKSNTSADRDKWEYGNIRTTFTNIQYDNNSGWNDNSFIVSGVDSHAIINYNPISELYDLANKGKTIEIDFKPEKIVNENDVLITIGDVNGGHIKITTNEASLYNGSTRIVYTNFKANERIKLAFIFNPVTDNNVDSNLIFIINNGILERAATYGTSSGYNTSSGSIKIGGSQSSVRVYSIRAYDKALSYTEALNNYIYDSDNKAEILNRNDIYISGVIDYTKVKNKIDTILITGDLSNILRQAAGKDDSESTVNFKRECITDASKNFEVTNGMIRKHGQSTLNYPITSMKIWTNKSATTGLSTTIDLSETQRAEGLNKNRYIMKAGAIPANKFVLQANYADSSGTHNGALLRLIQDTWYNANFGTIENPIYRLRTAPQLFASGYTLTHDNKDLHETGWVEGLGIGKAAGKTWPQATGKEFPYIIRNAPDSFPCAVFYLNGPDDGYHFLGLYVFMDDKKSDYIYGERSIYYFGNGNDPFVLKTENTKNGPLGKQDTSANCVWDNKDVLRIEVVLPNTQLSSYMSFDVTDTDGVTHSCTDIKYDKDTGLPMQYWWEDYFELIYPDDDDIAEDDAEKGLTKFDKSSKFVKKVTPFIDFLKWITDCKKNYNKVTDWWSAGLYTSTLQAFEATAHGHLDLYKIAAYYIFFLRFGLVDSVERNAQLKTYDGKHFHYEPWDMDIALGNTNQGSLTLLPPMDRNSLEPGTTTYAYSGKSLTTSNVLWDCLEDWEYWSNTVVPDVAQALYNAGLTYDNITHMFDEEYAEKWSETMFNQSGHFKYIENGGSDWLAWLLGARTSHRHWWVSTSMNYYDAKWSCGSFNEHRVRIFADKSINPVDTDIITIWPTSDTFFKIALQEGKTSLGTKLADRNNPAVFDISTASFSAKDPSYIYGGTYIEKIDLSCLAEKLKAADFSLCYDNVLGASIKELNVGLPYTQISDTKYEGKVSGTQLRLTAHDATTNTDAFENLLVLDITGLGTITTTQELLATRNRKNVQQFYGIGTNITEFVSSTSGNKFDTIKLPGVTTTTSNNADPVYSYFNTFKMTNSSWKNIEFWDTVKSGSIEYVRDDKGELVLDDDNQPVMKPNVATFTKSSIPAQLRTVEFRGSTASNECAGKFVLDWIASIEADLAKTNPSYTDEDLYRVLNTKTFVAENINWGTSEQALRITYNDLAKIALFNNGNNSGGLIKGYIMLADSNELSALQLNNLTRWFGVSVFTKSSKTSGLVVDLDLNYIRITTTGTYTQDGEICLREGDTATLSATKFVLSETDALQYQWSILAGENVTSFGVTNVNSVKLASGDDGVYYLIADSNGTYGDYYITVTASQAGINYTLTIKVIGVILPKDIQINYNVLSGSNPRKFYLNDAVADSMTEFKTDAYDENNNRAFRDSYVFYSVNQQVEFYPTKVDGDIPSQVDIGLYRYMIPGVLLQYSNSIDLSGLPDTIENRIGDGYIYYTKSATRNGIVIGVESLPDKLTVYTLRINTVIGGKLFTRNINIILYDDSQIMHSPTTSGGVLAVLNSKHVDLFGDALDYYYKSDLLSITGDLDFSQNAQQIGSIYADDNNSLLKYLPNITGLNFTGCSSLVGASLGEETVDSIQLAQLPKLTSIYLNGTPIVKAVDLTLCLALTTIDFRDSSAGIILVNSIATSVQLGSPSKISITSPTVLGDESTTFTVLNTSQIDDLTLIEVNTTNLYGFKMFYSLYLQS